MNAEESMAKSLEEIGFMIADLVKAINEIDQSIKVRVRNGGIKTVDIGRIAAAADNLGKNFQSRIE